MLSSVNEKVLPSNSFDIRVIKLHLPFHRDTVLSVGKDLQNYYSFYSTKVERNIQVWKRLLNRLL